jgi:hypothetical protein
VNANKVLHGVLAGAAGTAALDLLSYADMAFRDRPPSELPDKMVAAIARSAHAPVPDRNRSQAFGALLGYADGLSAGAVFALVRPRMRGVPWYAAALALAFFTMLLSEGTATAMQQTDPRRWGVSGWVSDILPRVVYGAVTCYTFDRL